MIQTLRQLGIIQIKDFDMLGAACKSFETGMTEAAKKKKNLDRAKYRLEKCIASAKSRAARKWYSKKLDEAEVMIAELQPTKIVQETNDRAEQPKEVQMEKEASTNMGEDGIRGTRTDPGTSDVGVEVADVQPPTPQTGTQSEQEDITMTEPEQPQDSKANEDENHSEICLLYTSPSPRDS